MAFVALLVGAAVFSLAQPITTQAGPIMPEGRELHENIVIKKADGEELVFSVELASSGAQQAQGLMNRTHLPEGDGMLFVFSNEQRRAFWMKNTLIPLDILFLRADGTIHHIHHMAKPLDESRITALEDSRAVLEINGGLSDRLGIKEGDKIYHSTFRNMNLLAQ
ncbi:MAG: DUF192 domain-containing protein [Alphaproteobacteria bacterium]|nr:DUF192 domain-containing protein [Alphaproteobacteria bacterium]